MRFGLQQKIGLLLSGLVMAAYPAYLFARKELTDYKLGRLPNGFIYRDFGATWLSKHRHYKKSLQRIKEQLNKLDTNGDNPWCLQQKNAELQWLVQSTDRDQEIEHLLANIEEGLRQPITTAAADTQDPKDGSWGTCFNEWFFKLDTSTDHILDLNRQGRVPDLPVSFLDRINSPEKLKAYLDQLITSDIAHDRIDHRKELNYVVPDLLRLVRRHKPDNYPFHEDLEETLLDFIASWQNQETGWWGASYRHNGELIQTNDLSITFHLASYLDGNIALKREIVITLLRNRKLPYPFGLMEDGKYTTHHNYDAVRLIRYGWPDLSEEERERVSVEIRAMLHHCLSEVLQKDGSFIISPADETYGDAFYFGVSFLVEAGYFDQRKRFWTSEEFPEAPDVRETILQKMASVKNPNVMLRAAITKLRATTY